ncbi:MAG: hypothetical protein AAF761_08300 [Pseudomonadota bacterium]
MIRALVYGLVVALTGILPPAAAKAETLEWTLRNNYPYIIYVKFYSKDRGHVWPSRSRSYIFNDGNSKTVRLSCRRGEKICFGGFTKSRRTYWGVGEQGNKGCRSCCRYCGQYYSATDVLN